jgi:hypothetical protein
MSETTTSKRPTHRVYAVSRRDGSKGYWKDIGAAWAHADGKGFSLKLEFLPLNGADLVVRLPEATAEASREGGEA